MDIMWVGVTFGGCAKFSKKLYKVKVCFSLSDFSFKMETLKK